MGVPPHEWGSRRLLLLLLLLPGSVYTTPPLQRNESATPGFGGCGGGWVEPGPLSLTAPPGSPLVLFCRFRLDLPVSSENVSVKWYRVCPPRGGCGDLQEEVKVGEGAWCPRGGLCTLNLTLFPLAPHHSGIYYCHVRLRGFGSAHSCGTFVRSRAPLSPILTLLPLGDDTKNRIIRTQGVLLLLCVGGPGLLLLFRKRWANEQLEQSKKRESEEERIYEGLDLAECSMYEDISRGGGAPTYQDVGTLLEPPLEKP